MKRKWCQVHSFLYSRVNSRLVSYLFWWTPSFCNWYTYIEYPLCVRNKTFDLDPLSHCFIYSLGVQDLSICDLVDERKDFVSCKQPVWGCGIFSVSCISEYAPCCLVKVLYIPEDWWLHAQVCCISGARRQESIYYMCSVCNLLGWKSLSRPAIDNRTPSLHKV